MLHDLNTYKIVKSVADKGSVSAAAEHLGISQPALTKKLQAIEFASELTLFKRDARGMSLTASGTYFLEQSEKLIVQADDFKMRLEAFREGNGGQLRIGTKTGLDHVFFTDVLLNFIGSNPDVSVEVDIDTTPRLIERLESGESDIALVARGYPDKSGKDSILNPGIEFFDLCALTFSFVLRNGHPALNSPNPIKDLFNYPLACPKAPSDILNVIAQHLETQTTRTVSHFPNILIDDYDALYRVIEASDHWTAVPVVSQQAVESRQNLVTIPDNGLLPALRVGYAIRTHWDPNPSAAQFIKLVKETTAKLN